MPSKYMGEKLAQIRNVIKEGRHKGSSNEEIAKALNKAKLTTSKGGKFTANAVFNFIYRTGLGDTPAVKPSRIQRPAGFATPPSFGAELDLAKMLLERDDISPEAKLEAVKSLLKTR